MFPKTGIKQTRLNDQSQEVEIQTAIRRVVIFPRTNQNIYTQAGAQENANYILYGEVGDDYKVGDYIAFNLSELYANLPFSDGEGVIKCEIKEPPKRYGTLKIGKRNQEIFLKSLY